MEKKEDYTDPAIHKNPARKTLSSALAHVSAPMLRERIRSAREEHRRTSKRLAQATDADSATLIRGLIRRRRATTRAIKALMDSLARKIELETENENSD